LDETSLRRIQWGSSGGRGYVGRAAQDRKGIRNKFKSSSLNPFLSVKLTSISNTGCSELPYATNTASFSSLTPSIEIGSGDP